MPCGQRSGAYNANDFIKTARARSRGGFTVRSPVTILNASVR
jgi:hypothetical protein